MRRLISLFLCLIALTGLSSCETDTDGKLEIFFLDVGKADAIVLLLNGECVVIDTGEEDNGEELASFLEMKKVQKISTLIHTHFDKDHIGGTSLILKSFEVGNIVESTFPSDRKEYDEYHALIDERRTTLRQITSSYEFSLGECKFAVLPPEKENYDKKADNNASLIITLSYKDNSFAFFGDAYEERIDEFLAHNENSFDFAKLPYHGNYLDNYPALLESISIENAVVCDSVKFPSEEKTVSLLEEKKISCFFTRNGTVTLTSDGEKITIKQ